MSNFTDPNGKHLFVEIVKAGNLKAARASSSIQAEAGRRQAAGQNQRGAGFAPWDWYLVTGMYMNDVRSAVLESVGRWLAMTAVLGGSRPP